MKLLFAITLGLSGCASTAASTATTAPTAQVEVVYDEQGNYVLAHLEAGVPVPDAAEENSTLVLKPTWASFEALEDVP